MQALFYRHRSKLGHQRQVTSFGGLLQQHDQEDDSREWKRLKEHANSSMQAVPS